MDCLRARAGLGLALRVALFVALAAEARAQAVKLNGPLAQPTSGDVLDFLLSPDGTRVVYRADELTDNAFELFSAPADGSGPTVRLNDPLAPGANVGGAGLNVFGAGGWDYAVSTTGRVVFLLDQNTNNLDELYSVPLDGSASPVRLNGPNVTGYGVMNFWILPGGTSVLYRADEGDTGNLYRVPLDGSAAAALITPNFHASRVWISPDGSRTAFTVPFGFDRESLYSVPTDGSAAPILLGTTVPPIFFGITVVENLLISDDSTHAVLHQALDEDGYEDADLISVPLDGSHLPWVLNQHPLNPYERPYVFDGAFRVGFFDGTELVCVDLDGTQRVEIDAGLWIPDTFGDALTLSADGTRVVFLARQGAQRALFSAPMDGSQSAIQLSTSGTAHLGQVEIAGSNVVYASDTNLYRVPLLGGQAPVLLNPAPFGNNTSFQLHPGGQDVVFRSEGGTAGESQVYTVPLDASALPRRLSAPLIPAGDVYEFLVAADGEHVVYRADQNHNETFELFGAPYAGGAVVTYNSPMALGPVVGDVDSFVVTGDERRVVYRADRDGDDVRGLFAARTDGRGASPSLTTGLREGCNVFEGFAVNPSGTRAAFLYAESPSSTGAWLYSASLGQPSLPVPLEVQSGFPLRAQTLAIDATGTRVLYRKQRTPAGAMDLRSARLDGVGSSLSLNAPSGSVREFQLAPDGSVAVYLSDQDAAGVIELYRAPTDGSAASVRLSAALAGSADVTALAIAPDGLHVVYLADATVDEQFELYVAPMDGSSPAQRISAPLVAGGDVKEFVLTQDGAYAVYRADALVDQTFELFRAPLAGGPVARLTSFPAGSVSADFATSADGLQVLFRANPNGPLKQELFRVPADGSANPVPLSGTLVTGGTVSAFALAPDQLHVVYLADARVDNVIELSGVPLAGGPSVVLHTLPADGDVTTFRIAADSSVVVYRADASQNDVFELFAAPPDGSAPSERLSRPLPSGGDVQLDFAALTGGRAIYLADQEADNVIELFAAFPDHAPRAAATPTQTRTVAR